MAGCVVCRVWDRDVFPSVIDVGPDEVLRRKIWATNRQALSSILRSMLDEVDAGLVLPTRAVGRT